MYRQLSKFPPHRVECRTDCQHSVQAANLMETSDSVAQFFIVLKEILLIIFIHHWQIHNTPHRLYQTYCISLLFISFAWFKAAAVDKQTKITFHM